MIEPFIPRAEGRVSMYTCGPTVYHYAHIGNLRTYVSEDVLERTLEQLGYEVDRVMNITDVGHLESDGDEGEDKMLKGAKREHKTVWEIAAYYTKAFFNDCKRLNIRVPKKTERATDYIKKYISFIKRLEEKGVAYYSHGNVYFDISTFERYTALNRMKLEDLQIASRTEVSQDKYKRNPQDFALWFTKSKFDDQAMKWDSPWGVGYPGWHIECSVIALENLGEQMDIHCGGVDHIATHHTNEIAQTESYTGKPWVNYWIHTEFLIDNTGKMSKSSGEFLTLSLLEEKGFDPLAYRYFLLESNYRKQLAFSLEQLILAQKTYYKLLERIAKWEEPSISLDLESRTLKEIVEQNILSKKATELLKSFLQSLCQDLNTANAMTALQQVFKSDVENTEKHQLIQLMDRVLGLDLTRGVPQIEIAKDEEAEIEQLIVERAAAKGKKDWARADAIRDRLHAMGVSLKDSKDGTTWRKE